MPLLKLTSLEQEKFYRLKYLGQLVEGENKEKLLEVFFQEVTNYHEYFNKDKGKDHPFLKGGDVMVKMNLRRLPALRVGSIYQGEDIVKRHVGFGKLVNLEISLESGRECTLEELIDISDTYYFNLQGQLNSKVWVFRNVSCEFKNPDDLSEESKKSRLKLVVIPTYEIIRFYYGFTSNLVSALFNGGLHTKEIFYPEYSAFVKRDDKEVPFVMLSKKIEDKCAKTVGRMVFDDVAFRSAAKIYDSLLESKKYNIYPSSGFPFKDQTNLLVNYESVTVKEKSKFLERFPELKDAPRIALVTEIHSCSHPFPFEDLDFLRINDGRSIADQVDHELEKRQPKRQKRKNTNENGKDPKDDNKDPKEEDKKKPPVSEDGEREPDGDDEKEIIKIEFPPFPNASFDASKVDKEDQKTTGKIINKLVKDSGRRTRGEGGKKNSGVIGKDSELVDHVLDQDTEKAFDSVVSNLNTLGATTEDCNLNDGQGYSFFPYSKFAQYSPAYDWCFLIKYEVLRKCFLIECKLSEEEFFYVMDVQRRLNNKREPKEHGFMVVFESKEDRRKLLDSELNEFLSHVALKEAVLKDMKGYEGLTFHGIKHLKDDTSETRAQRIISKIKSAEKNEL